MKQPTAQRVIAQDSLSAARAIHGAPRTSAEIKEMFDGITYEKGAAVLGMLEAYVGPEVFRNGRERLFKRALPTAMPPQPISGRPWLKCPAKPVDKIMPTFVMQPRRSAADGERKLSYGLHSA